LISAAQTVLDFTSATGGCTFPTAYFTPNNITFAAINNSMAQVCGSSPPAIPSGYFFIGPPVTNTPVSGDLVFSSPISQVKINTVAVDPVTSVPAWDVIARDGSGNLVDSKSEPALFPGGAVSVVLNGAGITDLHFDAFNTGGQTYNFPPVAQIVFKAGCPVNVTLQVGVPSDKYIQAQFKAPGSITLASYAASCNFKDFDWQQVITTLPCPSSFMAAPSSVGQANFCPDGSGTLTSPPNFADPPFAGYTSPAKYIGYNPFPFYYYTSVLQPGASCTEDDSCPPFPDIVSSDGTTLSFLDDPAEPHLPGVPRSVNPPVGTFLAFSTSLVGIDQFGNPSSPLFRWTWNSTFNGTAGGTAQTASLNPVDPGSGTGGITITSINGVPQVPPSVTCTATPNALWPPNGKSVTVAVNGTVTPGTSAIVAGTTAYAVIDEYGQVQPSGRITPDAGGNYSVGISLIAARNGDDKDGRTYTIVVSSKDTLGNLGSCSSIVTVPHDQGH
jgi:hypothetical protein